MIQFTGPRLAVIAAGYKVYTVSAVDGWFSHALQAVSSNKFVSCNAS